MFSAYGDVGFISAHHDLFAGTYHLSVFDSGVKELMTNALGEYIAENDNAKKCLGVVGSGNRNFNEQYCLTARKYAYEFKVPFLADYELRGTSQDVEQIYAILTKRWQQVNA